MITACRDARATLIDCLRSVSSQNLPPDFGIEHIVRDGASSDGSFQLIEDFVSGHDFAPRKVIHRVVSERDLGLYDALNKGLAMATGEIVGCLNADDFYASPDVLARVAQTFEDPCIDACYGDLVYFRRGDLRITRRWLAGPKKPGSFHAGWMPPHPAFFIRRSACEKVGGYRLDLGTAADYEWMLRAAMREGIRCAYLPAVVVAMRVGGASNRTLAARLKAHANDRRAWTVNGLRPHPWTLLAKPIRKLGQWWLRSRDRVERWWEPVHPAEISSKLAPPIRTAAACGMLGSLAMVISTAHSQSTVFRYSQAGPSAYALTKTANQAQHGNIKVWNFYYGGSLGLDIDATSNATYSASNPIPDIYVTPTLTNRFFWPITEVNSLDLGFSLGYRQGFNPKNPNRTQVTIGGDSTAFDLRLFAGDFMLRIYDAPALSSNPTDDPTFTNLTDYSVFSNALGASLVWDLYQLITTVGFEWRTQNSLNSDYNYLSQTNYVSYLTIFTPITNSISVGGFSSIYLTRYQGSFLADSNSITAGAAFEGSLTRYTSLSMQAGVQYVSFTGGSDTAPENFDNINTNGTAPPSNNSGDSYLGPYVQLLVNNQLNSVCSQEFSISNEAMPSSTANFAYFFNAQYRLQYRVLSNVSCGFSVQAGYGDNQGVYDDRFVILATGVQVNYAISRNVNLFIHAGYVRRESKTADLSYDTLTGGTGIGYQF